MATRAGQVVTSGNDIMTSKFHLAAIVGTFILFTIVVILMVSAGFGDGILFARDLLTSHYSFNVTFDIAPWVFFIWLPIGLWQFAWLLYAMTTICRRDKHSNMPLYCAPGSIPMSAFAMYLCTLLSILSVQGTLSHGYLELALICQLLVVITLFFVLYAIGEKTANSIQQIEARNSYELPLRRGLVMNGVGILAGWADFYFFLLFGKVLVFYHNVDRDVAGITALIFYMLYYFVGMILEITKWDNIIRHTVTPFLVQIWCTVGLYTRNQDFDEAVDYVIVTVLVLMLMITFARVITVIIKGRREANGNATKQSVILPAK